MAARELLDRCQAAEWKTQEAREAAERKRLKALPACPFRAGLREWPRDRCPKHNGPDGCRLWVDRGGWAVGCSIEVVAVALARGLEVGLL